MSHGGGRRALSPSGIEISFIAYFRLLAMSFKCGQSGYAGVMFCMSSKVIKYYPYQ